MFDQSVLPNGDLKFTLTGETLDYVWEQYVAGAWSDIADLVCEYDLTANGELYTILPEWIGALTSAPIFSDELDYDGGDTDTVSHVGRVWWFPDYQILDPMRILLDTGEVIFPRAPEE